jgi:hypothetical protein
VTLILGISAIIFPLSMSLIASRKDFSYLFAEVGILAIIALYLIIDASRVENEQQIVFAKILKQEKISEELRNINSNTESTSDLTNRERLVSYSNKVSNVLQQLHTIAISVQLKKEIEVNIEMIKEIKNEFLKLPVFASTEQSMMLCLTEEDCYYDCLDESLNLRKNVISSQNICEKSDYFSIFHKDWNFDVFLLKDNHLVLKAAKFMLELFPMVQEEFNFPMAEFTNFFLTLESVKFI